MSAASDRVVYRSLMSDNLRWDAIELRDGDIVISAPSKCGMTWTQRLVSLLVFDGPGLPGPMATVSPWLDQTIRPIDDVVAALAAQQHRRFIKTHTPLDGLILDDRVTYLGVGRDPRDAAVSMLFQSDNMDPQRMRALHEAAMPHPPHPPHPPGPPGGPPGRFSPPGADFSQSADPLVAFRDWMERPIMPPEGMGSLATILHHLDTVWRRRRQPNVVALHYADLQADLVGELLRLATVLGYHLTPDRAQTLAGYATLDAMRARASELAPNSVDGVWRDDERFFRAGGRGDWRQFFTEVELRRYRHRCSTLAPQDLLAWAHDGDQARRRPASAAGRRARLLGPWKRKR